MSRAPSIESAPEEFYASQWSHPQWSRGTPNQDEADRWAAMQSLVRRALSGIDAPRILDLGCGRGWLTHLLAEHGDVLGVDPLEASVTVARRLFPHLAFLQATGSDLLHTEGKDSAAPFHLLVSSEVIEHVPDRDKPRFLAEARQLLASGGHLLLTTPRGELWTAWRRRAARTQPVEEWITEAELDRMAEEAGFELIERSRAHLMRRPVNWQGKLLRYVLARRYVRHLPLFGVRRWLANAGRMYQVGLWRKGEPV